ncbi:MAG: AAA family ATPase [Fibrobacteria bacterium]|nr:AAA family ATPase [Fibrobacteria bacterium]
MTPSAEKTDLLHTLHRQIVQEAESARHQVRKMWSAPLRERAAQGKSLEGARVHSASQEWVHLDLPDHDALFREGDLLIWTESGNPDLESRAELVLAEDRGDLWVCMIRSGRHLLSVGSVGVLDFGFLDVSRQLEDALRKAGDSVKGRERILPLLEGTLRPSFDSGLHADAVRIGEAEGLNESQIEGLALAWSTDLAALIQGPPGTGKTAVLSLLAQMAARKGHRVLVTGLTHRAIDNALAAIRRRDPDLDIARIGSPTRTSKAGIPCWDSFVECPWSESDRGFVVGATPFCVQNHRLAGVEFDLALFDESSQITLPLAIMAMNGARRWVFFGDQHQLPPVLPTLAACERLEGSVFGALQDRDFDQMLETTYRLNDVLCRWPSREFYGGRLAPSPEAGARRLTVAAPKGPMGGILDPSRPLVHVPVLDPSATTSSRPEAEWVGGIVQAALEGGVAPVEIAVISPFRRQNRRIRKVLRERLGSAAERIVVDTVERMQGQERDLVVLSLTSGSEPFVERMAEFYFLPQRLNVAATRARSKLVLVGRADWTDLFERRPDLQEQGNSLRALLEEASIVDPLAWPN